MSFTDKLATYLKNHAGEWLDGREIAEIAGCYGWRTRLSELRKAPYFMAVENKQVHHTRHDRGCLADPSGQPKACTCGHAAKWTTSLYRYVPPEPVETPEDAHDANSPWTLQ